MLRNIAFVSKNNYSRGCFENREENGGLRKV